MRVPFDRIEWFSAGLKLIIVDLGNGARWRGYVGVPPEHTHYFNDVNFLNIASTGTLLDMIDDCSWWYFRVYCVSQFPSVIDFPSLNACRREVETAAKHLLKVDANAKAYYVTSALGTK